MSTAPPADARERFSSRVADYVKYRPSYPAEVVDILRREAGLGAGSKVADVGSGTGISSRLLLDAGAEVFAVEPNAGMRAAAEAASASDPRFHSVAAGAEATTLADASMDLVLCAQAFHWFDHPRAKVEFGRILRGRKPVALLWNDRKLGGSAFLDAYELALRTHGTDYAQVNHRNLTTEDTRIRDFFDGHLTLFETNSFQDLDLDGLLGRAFSSSYTPKAGTPERAKLEAALTNLFHTTSQAGTVRMEYITQLFLGHL